MGVLGMVAHQYRLDSWEGSRLRGEVADF